MAINEGSAHALRRIQRRDSRRTSPQPSGTNLGATSAAPRPALHSPLSDVDRTHAARDRVDQDQGHGPRLRVEAWTKKDSSKAIEDICFHSS